MEKRYAAFVMILLASLLILSLSLMFYLQQEGIMRSCEASSAYPACYPHTGLAFALFGFVIVLVLLGAAYHVKRAEADIVNRWSVVAMVSSLLAYEVNEFAYLTNLTTPYYFAASSLPQSVIIAGYLGALLAFLGGIIGLSMRTTRIASQMGPQKQAKAQRKRRGRPATKRKR